MMEHSDPRLKREIVLHRWGEPAKNPAVYLAMLLLLAGGYFGSSKGFGNFLISITILAILFAGAAIEVILAEVRKAERSGLMIACMLIGLTPVAYLCSYGFVQQVRFLIWAPGHYRQLAEASKRNGVIIGWDSWGMAGQDTFSYLVADTEDRLNSKARAEQLTKQIGQSCGAWKQQRVWPKLYIVTTYSNCPYYGIEPAD